MKHLRLIYLLFLILFSAGPVYPQADSGITISSEPAEIQTNESRPAPEKEPSLAGKILKAVFIYPVYAPLIFPPHTIIAKQQDLDTLKRVEFYLGIDYGALFYPSQSVGSVFGMHYGIHFRPGNKIGFRERITGLFSRSQTFSSYTWYNSETGETIKDSPEMFSALTLSVCDPGGPLQNLYLSIGGGPQFTYEHVKSERSIYLNDNSLNSIDDVEVWDPELTPVLCLGVGRILEKDMFRINVNLLYEITLNDFDNQHPLPGQYTRTNHRFYYSISLGF